MCLCCRCVSETPPPRAPAPISPEGAPPDLGAPCRALRARPGAHRSRAARVLCKCVLCLFSQRPVIIGRGMRLGGCLYGHLHPRKQTKTSTNPLPGPLARVGGRARENQSDALVTPCTQNHGCVCAAGVSAKPHPHALPHPSHRRVLPPIWAHPAGHCVPVRVRIDRVPRVCCANVCYVSFLNGR